jgi:CBS domain-containing protein
MTQSTVSQGVSTLRARDVMTSTLVTARGDMSLEQAVGLMLEHRVSGLPVLESDGRLVGIVTEGDLLRRSEAGTARVQPRWWAEYVAPGRAAHEYVQSHGRKVSELMTTEVITVGPAALLAEVVALFETKHIKRVPVLEHGRLVGIIARADLLRVLLRLLPTQQSAVASDAELRRCVLAAIDREPWAPRNCIDVKVENAVVQLCGLYTTEWERKALRVLAENVPGVKEVRDSLVWIDPATGLIADVNCPADGSP